MTELIVNFFGLGFALTVICFFTAYAVRFFDELLFHR